MVQNDNWPARPTVVRTIFEHQTHAQVINYHWCDTYYLRTRPRHDQQAVRPRLSRANLRPLVWLWFYAAFGITLLQYGLRFPNYLFDPRNTTDIFLRIGVPMIAMLLLKLWAEGGMGLMHTFENLLASLSHTISYVRILAMKLIDDVFLRLFLGVLVTFAAWGNPLGTALGWILFAALTTVLILILETAFVFMQTFRFTG